VPLSLTAKEVLLGMGPGKPSEYLFKGRQPDSHLSENTLPQTMRRDMALADEFVPHSWRSAFRTLAGNAEDAEGRPLFSETWLEAVLDHQKASAVEAAYSRKQQMSKGAARAMQWWADLLTGKEETK
jgi:integrase